MSKASRDKGIRGEWEVKTAFQTGGFAVRGLEGEGDQLIVCGAGLTLHVEVKRAESLRMSEWSRQAETEAPQGTVPILAYRRNREPWRVAIKLDDLIAVLRLSLDPDADQFRTMINRLTNEERADFFEALAYAMRTGQPMPDLDGDPAPDLLVDE